MCSEGPDALIGVPTVELDGEQRVLHGGDSLEIPVAAPHRMWNSGGGTARATWRVRPALRTESFFETVHRLNAAGRTGKDGMLTPLAGGILLREFPDEFRLPLPTLVQRPLAHVLAELARLRGYPSP